MRKTSLVILSLFVVILSSCFENTTIKSSSESPKDSFSLKRLYVFINKDISDSIEINLIKDMKAEDIQWCYDNWLGDGEMNCQPVELQEKIVDVSMKIYGECLPRKGYKKPSDEIIKKRSLEIFGVDLSDEANDSLYPLNLARYVYPESKKREREKQREVIDLKLYGEVFHHLFWESLVFDKKSGIIVNYPDARDIVNIEGSLVKENKDGEIEEVVKLGDTISYNLSDSQLSDLLHINRYIFYNSKASFVWLMQNRKSFLTDLCKIYGYDTVPDINDMVIDEACHPTKIYKYDVYKDVFVHQNVDGTIKIHEGLLNYMGDYLRKCDETEYVYVQSMFNTYKDKMVWSLRGNVPDELQHFSLTDRMKIAAYVGYYYNKAIKIETDEPFRRELANNEDFVTYIKDNNFFNLEGFEELIDKLIDDNNTWHELEQARINNYDMNNTEE